MSDDQPSQPPPPAVDPSQVTDNWYTPSHKNSRQLFQEPRKITDNSDVAGSSPRPHVDQSVPARSNIKLALDTRPQRKLFQEPREINKLVNEPTYSERYRPIKQNREPSPVKKRCFQNSPREDTKSTGQSVPQIDLSKPTRKAVGCQSPIQSARRQLFQNPRNIHYDDVEGSHPRSNFDASKQPTSSSSIYTIPNQPRLFDQPREIMTKYQEVPGAQSKNQINLNVPERGLDKLPEREERKLFQQPRDWTKLPSSHRTREVPTRRPQEIEQQKQQLFKVPRETMKYQDVDGSHPTQYYPRNPRKPSPTFASHDIIF